MKTTISMTIDRDADALFALSQDYPRRLEWDSYLSEARLVGEAAVAGVGVDAYCKSHTGQTMVSRYVSYRPPQVAAVTMIDGPWLFHSFSGSWRFSALSDQQTQVAFSYSFRTKPRWLSPIVEPLLAWVYSRQMASRLAAFKRWAET